MKISYLEAEKRGWSYEDVYVVTFSELDYYVKELLKLYPIGSINKIPEYALQIFKKMLDMWESLHIIYSHTKDYVSVCVLCRSILDNLAIIYHIYLEPNSNELILKHCLYVLDGVNARLKDMEEEMKYDGTINNLEFLKLKNHCLATKESDVKAQEFILSVLSNYDFIDDSIINNANWRYKTLTPCSNSKNQISWTDLYLKIDSRPFFKKLMNNLSTYVHGLSLSNLGYVKNDETFEPIFCLSIECIDSAIKAIKTIYKEEINVLQLNFKSTETATNIMLSVKDEYLHFLYDNHKEKSQN